MSKLPAFQFYPGDWRKDPGVQALDFETRGVWFEILCLMHESDRRGVLLLNGVPMPEEAIARLLGIDPVLLKQILTKLEAYGVASREHETSALVCRRMVRDEKLRSVRADAGHLGGKQRLLKQNSSKPEASYQANPERLLKQNSSKPEASYQANPEQKGPPSSSSSSSEKIGVPREELGGEVDPEAPMQSHPVEAEVIAHAAATMPPIPQAFALAWFAEMEGAGWVDRHQRPVHPMRWKRVLEGAARNSANISAAIAARAKSGQRPALPDAKLHSQKSKFGF